jgi:transcriptional regulator with XRE-family HTH domain
MNAIEFMTIRKKLKKTQREMAHLLGTSLKTIHSYEQGWRRIPYYVERHLLYLLFVLERVEQSQVPCWELKGCPEEVRERCLAWQLRNRGPCWFLNGTFCSGV